MANYRVYVQEARDVVIAHDVDFSKNMELDGPSNGGSMCVLT